MPMISRDATLFRCHAFAADIDFSLLRLLIIDAAALSLYAGHTRHVAYAARLYAPYSAMLALLMSVAIFATLLLADEDTNIHAATRHCLLILHAADGALLICRQPQARMLRAVFRFVAACR